jgi:hypothetical protein
VRTSSKTGIKKPKPTETKNTEGQTRKKQTSVAVTGSGPIWHARGKDAFHHMPQAAKSIRHQGAEIQFGSHVHMLPMSKNYISECQKIQTKNFTCTSS